MERKVLLITTYDSFLKSGYLVASQLSNSVLDIYIHTEERNIKELSLNQLKELGLDGKDINYFHLDDYFFNEMYLNYDVIVLSVGNSLLNRFYKLQYKIYSKQINNIQLPISITLFPGVIFGDKASILSRMLSDIVLYLCPYDFEQGEIIKKLYGFQCTNVLYGFSKVLEKAGGLLPHDKKIYFIDQVIIPASKEDRLMIIKGLIGLAKRYPSEKFIILPRIEEGERTVHRDSYPYRELVKEFELPPNLIVQRVPISEALTDMKLCISMSSTVVFEAIALDIPIYILKELGVRPEFANISFVESGVMGLLSDLNVNKPTSLNTQWKKRYYYYSPDQAQILNCVIKNYKFVEHPYENYKKQINKTLPFFYRLGRKFLKLLKNPKLFFRDSICGIWLRK